MKKYRVGDLIIVLNSDGDEMQAQIAATPLDDDYDLELAQDEIAITWDFEDVDSVEIINIKDIIQDVIL